MSRYNSRKNHKQISAEQNKELITKDEDQEYATVTKVLGGSRFDVACFDSVNRVALARGTLHMTCGYAKVGDLVLVSLRDFQDNMCDIIHLYSAEDIRRLKAMGELPDAVAVDKDSNQEDMPFDFGEFGDL